MAIVADPCRDFHPEMALLLEITALNERLPQFLFSRDPQQHPRDETGRYVQGGERG